MKKNISLLLRGSRATREGVVRTAHFSRVHNVSNDPWVYAASAKNMKELAKM